MILAQAGKNGSYFVPGVKPEFVGSFIGQVGGIFKSTSTTKRICIPMAENHVVKAGEAWARYAQQSEYKLPTQYGSIVATGKFSTTTETLQWVWNGKEWIPPRGYKLVEVG
jgi:hypothetical protein